MSSKSIALDLAAFLDSPQAAQLEGIDREDVRRVAQAYLECCYEQLGKKPRLLDGQDVHAVVGHLLPGHFGRADRRAGIVPDVLRAFLEHLERSEVVTQRFEQRQALESTLPEFEESVRTGSNAHHAPPKRQQPVVHQAPKLGRNEPCSCGSGKKFKKCHGKGQ